MDRGRRELILIRTVSGAAPAPNVGPSVIDHATAIRYPLAFRDSASSACLFSVVRMFLAYRVVDGSGIRVLPMMPLAEIARQTLLSSLLLPPYRMMNDEGGRGWFARRRCDRDGRRVCRRRR